jgi:uncharacterized integral membrane protein
VETERRPSLTERLEEGRRIFQPGLWARLLAVGIVAVFLLLFVVLNTRTVKVSLVVGSTHLSLIWVILLSLAAGLLIGVLASQLYRRSRR